MADATWLALNVVSGGGGFSGSQPIGVTKIAKSVIAPLADHNISVFMLSTYQTDFILVRKAAVPSIAPPGATFPQCVAWPKTVTFRGGTKVLGPFSCFSSMELLVSVNLWNRNGQKFLRAHAILFNGRDAEKPQYLRNIYLLTD